MNHLRCDEEYTRKIQQRHELTLQYIEDIHDYKKELFYYLLDHKDYKVSVISFSLSCCVSDVSIAVF